MHEIKAWMRRRVRAKTVAVKPLASPACGRFEPIVIPLIPLTCLLALAGCAEPAAPPATPSRVAATTPAASLAPAPSPKPAPTLPGAVTQPQTANVEPGKLIFKPLPLPGAMAPASLDYLAFEPGRSRVWVPVGGTGSVDVYDIAAATFTRVDGFVTAQREYKGKTRTVGPSAVAIGAKAAYIGNRASNEVCPVDTETLKVGACLKLGSPTDGVAYVASAKEVWVTTPRSRSIAVLDATHPLALAPKATIVLEGAPEGYAVDAQRGLFFTNLEDKNKTVVLDIATHTTKASWDVDCGSDGPRGVATDSRGLVYVACTDRVLVLDGGHGGQNLASIDTGAGVDNIDWLDSDHLLYVASARSARVAAFRIDDRGQPTAALLGESVQGARNGVVDAKGNVYVADPANARLLAFVRSPRP
jgi:DNA-binding beta-propeller fold protein YncE